MQQSNLFTLTFEELIKQIENRIGQLKGTGLPFIQNLLKKQLEILSSFTWARKESK